MPQIRMRLHDQRPIAFATEEVVYVAENPGIRGQSIVVFDGGARISVDGSFADIAELIFGNS